MEARKPCKFDKLFTKSVPHILETIFLSLDFESFNTCLEVSTTWRLLLTAEPCRQKVKSVFHAEIFCDEWKLWQAAKEGNVEKVRSLLSSIFVDVNCLKGGFESTPLYEAVCNYYKSAPSNHKNVIQLLLARGADPDLGNQSGWTPLHEAAWSGNRDVMQLLLDRGANPNGAAKGGLTPLHIAARWCNKDTAQFLLNAGAEPNRENNSGETPLTLARQHDHWDIVKLLNSSAAPWTKFKDSVAEKLKNLESCMPKVTLFRFLLLSVVAVILILLFGNISMA